MIRYRLVCARGHEFETWFQSSAAYDRLAAEKELTCASCGSHRVEKAMMAPRIGRSNTARSAQDDAAGRADDARAALHPAGAEPAARDTSLAPSPEQLALAALSKALRANADYVGPDFAEEARRRHDDHETEGRGIYGEASMAEARALIEDGIPVMPLPTLPDKAN
jgi:hypothetical protein